MKILFISYAYDSGWTYQENLLPQACIENGHDVLCVASNVGVTNTGTLENKEYDNDPGYIRRLDTIFTKFLKLSVRIRYLKDLFPVIEEFGPDVIFLHSMQTFNLWTLKRYKKKYPNVKIYYNSHTDYYTSGTNLISMVVLHKLIYKNLLNRYKDIAEKFFYVSPNCGRFMWEVYKIPREKTELMLLGGTVQSLEKIADDRKNVCEELGIPEESIIFVQAGKMDEKKCLVETLKAFRKTSNNKFVLLIVGTISNSIKEEAETLIAEDDRIYYLGWKKDKQLIRCLCAADVYVQPGKVSAILQTAMCCGCAMIANDLEDYRILINSDNGWLISDANQVAECMKKIELNPDIVESMKISSRDVALNMLEQRNLVKKFTEQVI